MEVSVNDAAKIEKRSCLGRCKHFFWLGVTFDTVGAAMVFTGVFTPMLCYDMFLYLGASIIFFSLLWWTFWYSGNIELSPEEALNSPYRLPSAYTLEVLSQTISNRFTFTIGSVSNTFMRIRRRRRLQRQRFLEGRTSLDMTVTGQVESQLDQDKDWAEGVSEKGEAQDFGSKDLPKPEAVKIVKEAGSQVPDAGDLGREASLPKFVKGPSTNLVQPFMPSPLDQPPTPVILTSKSLPVVSLASMSQSAPILTSESQPVIALASTSQPLAVNLVSVSQFAAPLPSTSQPPPLLTSKSQSEVSLAVVSSTSQPPAVTLASTRQPAVPLTSATQPRVVFASKSLPVVSLSFTSQPLTVLTSEGHPLMPVTSQSPLLVPAASEGHSLVPVASQSHPLVPVTSQGQLPVPVASEGHPLVPVAAKGQPLVPRTSQSHPLVPRTSQSQPLAPRISQSHPLVLRASQSQLPVPVASEGHPLVPVASEGHSLVPVASEGHPLVPRASQSYPLVPRTSQSHPLVPLASQSQLPVPVASEGHPLVPLASQHQLQNLLEVCQTGPPPLQASQAQSLATISLLQVLPTESLQTQPVDLQVAQAILDLQATYHTQQASQSSSLVQEIRPSQPPSAPEFYTEPVALETPPPADQELSQNHPDAAALPPQSPAPAAQAQQSVPSGRTPTLVREKKSHSI
ncbi:PREDICTED: histone-lysine N-methyltransferase 2B [Capra hircus]|uniref:histone-lysine N-methyltransferase 2B n=1 Tax=Capra hircus TaxID=9925 RepID=UPI000846ABAA|nr:PREDICTED: histone-lysine N-methyltransferase 2B [Capra hircus]